MSPILPILAIFSLAQDAPASIRLFHYGATSSTDISARVHCDPQRSATVEFTTTSRGVTMKSPRFPRIGELEKDISESRWRLFEIGRLRDWKTVCAGSNVLLLIFRGYDRAERQADTVVLEIVNGAIVDAPDPKIARRFLSRE